MNYKTRKIVLNGLLTALVCIATMVIQIPTPGTNGYINVGDGIIFISSILFGPASGMVAGGIGSALADILSGYSHWALFTLIIKGFEGYLVGVIIRNNHTIIKNIIATGIGSIVMIIGYFLAGGILNGSFIASAASIPSNAVQGMVSMVIAIVLSNYLSKVSYVKAFKLKVKA